MFSTFHLVAIFVIFFISSSFASITTLKLQLPNESFKEDLEDLDKREEIKNKAGSKFMIDNNLTDLVVKHFLIEEVDCGEYKGHRDIGVGKQVEKMAIKYNARKVKKNSANDEISVTAIKDCKFSEASNVVTNEINGGNAIYDIKEPNFEETKKINCQTFNQQILPKDRSDKNASSPPSVEDQLEKMKKKYNVHIKTRSPQKIIPIAMEPSQNENLEGGSKNSVKSEDVNEISKNVANMSIQGIYCVKEGQFLKIPAGIERVTDGKSFLIALSSIQPGYKNEVKGVEILNENGSFKLKYPSGSKIETSFKLYDPKTLFLTLLE